MPLEHKHRKFTAGWTSTSSFGSVAFALYPGFLPRFPFLPALYGEELRFALCDVFMELFVFVYRPSFGFSFYVNNTTMG